jgi:glycosyltransferase involved in cell wall biosynthesis
VPLTVLSVAYPLARVSEGTAGGAEQVLLTIDEALVEHGHRSLVLAAAGSRCYGLHVPVQVPSRNLDPDAKREARRLFRQALDRTLQTHSVDIVHMHGIDFAEYLPEEEVPVVVSLHLPLDWYSPKVFEAARKRVSLVCVSRSHAQTARLGLQIADIISNGVMLDRFQPTAIKGDYVLFMGRICREKGVHRAIEAAKRAGEKLLIAGTIFDYPEHREYFQNTVRPRLGPEAVFLGSVGGMRKAELLAGAKCLLIPSLAPETSSLTAMEAMASGTPVVAWRSGALPEVVAHGRTGLLVSSVEEMSNAIHSASSLSSAECRREAEWRFSSEHMVAGYLELYNKILRGTPAQETQAA